MHKCKAIGILKIVSTSTFLKYSDGMCSAERCVKNKGSLKNERILVMAQIIYMAFAQTVPLKTVSSWP